MKTVIFAVRNDRIVAFEESNDVVKDDSVTVYFKSRPEIKEYIERRHEPFYEIYKSSSIDFPEEDTSDPVIIEMARWLNNIYF